MDADRYVSLARWLLRAGITGLPATTMVTASTMVHIDTTTLTVAVPRRHSR
jgi:hypothetical protein